MLRGEWQVFVEFQGSLVTLDRLHLREDHKQAFCVVGKAPVCPKLVNPRTADILNFSEIQTSLICCIDWTPALDFSRSF